MKEFITIKDFGPLKELERVEIKPVTVLIGESAIGKSTLMKVLALMRYLYKMANIRSYLRHSNITRSPFRIRIEDMLKKMEMAHMLKADSRIEYLVRMDNGSRYSITIEKSRSCQLPFIAEEDLIFTKVSYISENRNIIPMWVERVSKNAGATLGYYFHETNDDFSHASEEDQMVDLNHVSLKLHITHPKGKAVKLRIESTKDQHSPIELREASSGVQSSAPLVLIMKYFARHFSFKDAFNRSVLNYLHDVQRLTKFKAVTEASKLSKWVYVHIEEPELSLFPDAQCKLVEELLNIATHTSEDRKLNLMFATHSPYILNYLNIILNQTDEKRAHVSASNMAVYRIYEGQVQNLLVQDDKGHSVVDTYDLTEMMGNIYREFNELKA